ncbi:MAG TPA: 5'-nucleotidase C-terminal domain-containing protein [Clostridia bacterium]|nr:5'-nucleotidase C-terminal domain-containing protein [Clostridia bacterium]
MSNNFLRKNVSITIILILIISMFAMPMTAFGADGDTVNITLLGTSDIHGAINSYDYATGDDYGERGLAIISSIVNQTREESENTLLVDNGDTIQGSLLTDDLYNSDLTKDNPMIALMNIIGYDAMVLGNHEFNFGLDLVEKIVEEANFPILSANTYLKEDGSNYVGNYIVKEYDGVKVGILGLTVPSIPKWDGPKVEPLEFKHMADEAEKYIAQMKDEGVDVVIVSAHSGLDSRHETDGGDAARLIAERTDADVLITGHDHVNVNEVINGTLVVAPKANYGYMAEVAKVELTVENNNGEWEVTSKVPSFLQIGDYEADPQIVEASVEYDQVTKDFVSGTIGTATGDFHPPSKVEGIPEAQIKDTAVIDLINDVQLEYTGADVSAAALFKPSSNIKEGDITYSDIFDIYKYPNTLYAVEVSGAELKDYMEWSASYFNTYEEGDLTISFNPDIRGYNYDMFAGVDYQIDISKPAGERIVNLTMNGEPITDDQTIKLTVNNYRYGGLTSMEIISNEEYFNSDPKSLRSYIKDYIEEKGTISPTVDNNWEIIGADLDHPLRDEVIAMVNSGEIEIPTSEDGRTANVESLNINELIAKGVISVEEPVVEEPVIEEPGSLETDQELIIVHTNDTHSRIKSGKYDGMGFAAIATKVKELRENNKNVLLFDAGDAFHGQVISQLNDGESVVRVMNTMNYDAMVPGNHDFNYGQERLIELDVMTDFPILASNVFKGGSSLLPKSRIIYKDGLKIGVFGLATPETLYKTHPNNVKGLDFLSPSIVAKQMVKKLESETDVIIALSHLGIDESTKEEYTSKYVAEMVNGIDLIIDGHSHTALSEGMMVNNTLIVQAGEYDKNLGIVTLGLNNKSVVNKVAKLFTKEEAESVEDDIDIINAVADIEAANSEITSVVVASSDMELNGEREFVRTGQTNLGNLITKAMLEETKADIAITNGGGIRASINPGPVTKGDVITVLPFGNYVIKQEITGEDILAAMEHGLSAYPEAQGFFPHIAGMEVKFDSTKEAGNRVTEIMINGELLDDSKTYTMATNDFMAAGGDNYTMFSDLETVTEYGGLDEILIDWMSENGTDGAEVDNRLMDISDEVSSVLFNLLAA